jgi:hypothetical protein
MRFAFALLLVLGCGNVKADSDAAVPQADADTSQDDAAPEIDASTEPGPCVLGSSQLGACTL